MSNSQAHGEGRGEPRGSLEVLPEPIEISVHEHGIDGFLVVHSRRERLAMGGMRVSPSVTERTVEQLAEGMTLKHALHGGHSGGAKAGIRCAPDHPDLPRFLLCFAEACRELLLDHVMLGKDMGAQQWMLDTLYGGLSRDQLAAWRERMGIDGVGAPTRLCDLRGYIGNMTGRGAFWATRAALGELAGKRVLIQGFGVVGRGVATWLEEEGAIIAGVSDVARSLIHLRGDTSELRRVTSRVGALPRAHEGWSAHEAEVLLEQPADVLVLAADSHTVDLDVAERIRCPIIIEASNIAILPAARARLAERGIVVIPDVVASSSSAAMVGRQLGSGNTTEPETMWREIQDVIERQTIFIRDLGRAQRIDTRMALEAHVMQSGLSGAGAVDG